jgi:predicted dienelactone hydrolase
VFIVAGFGFGDWQAISFAPSAADLTYVSAARRSPSALCS